MPYMLVGNCVHKQNSDGSAGDTVDGGCHDTHDQAVSHLQALEVNVTNTSKTDISSTKATDYFIGASLKALGEGKVGGYLVVFGGPKDAQGEFFDRNCDFHTDWFGGTRRPVLYHHGMNDDDIIEDIGYISDLRPDNHGLYAEAQLDMSNPRAQSIYNDVRRGKLGWSSGSAPHLSKIDEHGRITEWALIEASLTPTPAAGKRTVVSVIKFNYTSTDITPDGAATEPLQAIEHAVQGDKTVNNAKLPTKAKQAMKTNTKGQGGLIAVLRDLGVDSDTILQAIEQLEQGEMPDDGMMADTATGETQAPPTATMAAPDGEADDGAEKSFTQVGDGGADIHDTGSKPAMTPPGQNPPGSGVGKAKAGGNEGKALGNALQLLMATMKTAPAASKANGGYTGQNPAHRTVISDMKTAYHDLSAADMAFLYEMRRQGKKPREMGLEYEREMATKAMKDYREDKLRLEPETARKVAIKLDFNNTTSANDGGNWVPDLWSSILWMRVRIDNNVAKNVEVFQMPSPTFEYPIESTDPIVYSVGESDTDAEQTLATNVFTRSKLVVSKLQFTAKKTGLQVGFSTEIEEDSIIPFIPQLRAQATRAFANSIDFNILNSDSTTGTGNINYKGANTSAAPTSNFLFGGGNGMRYNAINTGGNLFYNFQGGIPTLAGLRKVRFSMINSLNAYGITPEDIVLITDPYTYGSFLGIDEINVFMNNGRNATVNTGYVPAIDGTDVFPSQELKLADSTGYVLADGSATLGNFVFFAKNAWKVGYVRQVMTDVSYVPWNDSYILTMTARYAIGKKDTMASAVGYNLKIITS